MSCSFLTQTLAPLHFYPSFSPFFLLSFPPPDLLISL